MLDGTFLTALPINNSGVSAAQNVTAIAITLSGGTLATSCVPFNLGTITAGGSTVLNADFSDTFNPLADEVCVSGTYCVRTATFCFELTSNFHHSTRRIWVYERRDSDSAATFSKRRWICPSTAQLSR